MERRIRLALAEVSIPMLLACAPSAPPAAPMPAAAPPTLLTLPGARYPDMLASANVEGDVLLDVAVDSAGRTSWARTKVRKSSHDLFTVAVRKAYQEARWAAVTEGVVRDVWRDTIEFRLLDSATPCEAARAHHRRVCALATARSQRQPMSGAERDRLVGMLRAGRARWRSERPARYRMEVTENQGMIAHVGPRSRIIVEIAGDSIVRTIRRPVATLGRTWRTTTVEQLFAWAEHHIRTTSTDVDVLELDPRYGFPRRLHSDLAGTTDSETDVRVEGFEARGGQVR